MSCPCQSTSYTEQPGATKAGLQSSPSRKQSSLLGQLLPGTHRKKRNGINGLMLGTGSCGTVSLSPAVPNIFLGPGRAGMKAGSVNLAQLPGWD